MQRRWRSSTCSSSSQEGHAPTLMALSTPTRRSCTMEATTCARRPVGMGYVTRCMEAGHTALNFTL